MSWYDFFSTYNEDEFIATTGLTPFVFQYIFIKYCGCDTPITKPYQLFCLFTFYKIYPVRRLFRQLFGIAPGQSARFLSQLYVWECHLAGVIEELSQSWDDRLLAANRLPHLFDRHVTGSIDTFPIRVFRPHDSGWQSNLYNGKYKAHVVKIQAITDHLGTIIWYSGLHIGTTSDIDIYRQNSPPLLDGEKLLADKAYQGERRTLIVPFKKKKGEQRLTPIRYAFNRVHQWYRATVEHSFAYIKRFHILNGRYRGRISRNADHLQRAAHIIIHASAIYTRTHPHRQHLNLFHEFVDYEKVNYAAVEVREWNDEDGGTSHTIDDFRRGMTVEVRLNNEWWPAEVRFINRRRCTVSVRFEFADVVTAGIPPTLLRHACIGNSR
jgi:hypothetical protein